MTFYLLNVILGIWGMKLCAIDFIELLLLFSLILWKGYDDCYLSISCYDKESIAFFQQTICLQFVYKIHNTSMADWLSDRYQNLMQKKIISIIQHGCMVRWPVGMVMWSIHMTILRWRVTLHMFANTWGSLQVFCKIWRW